VVVDARWAPPQGARQAPRCLGAGRAPPQGARRAPPQGARRAPPQGGARRAPHKGARRADQPATHLAIPCSALLHGNEAVAARPERTGSGWVTCAWRDSQVTGSEKSGWVNCATWHGQLRRMVHGNLYAPAMSHKAHARQSDSQSCSYLSVQLPVSPTTTQRAGQRSMHVDAARATGTRATQLLTG
jgi:hypothetical protein